MAVDPDIRTKLRESIIDFVESRIDGIEFDDLLCSIRTKDHLCNAIIDQLWYFYDDVNKKYFSDAAPFLKKYTGLLQSWSLLLETHIDLMDEEYCQTQSNRDRRGYVGRMLDWFYGRRPAFMSNQFWPFSGEDEWGKRGVKFVK